MDSNALVFVHIQPKRVKSEHYHNSLFTFPVIPDTPLPSSLAFQAYSPFPSVVKLVEPSSLGWRAVNHEHEALQTPALSLLLCLHILPSGLHLWPIPIFLCDRGLQECICEIENSLVYKGTELQRFPLYVLSLKRALKAAECIVESSVPMLSHFKLLWVQFSHAERNKAPRENVAWLWPRSIFNRKEMRKSMIIFRSGGRLLG